MTEIMGTDRLRIETDGEGISTLVVFYGCPLHCKYCINPQCHDEKVQRAYIPPKYLKDELMKDDIYYQSTGGGITFGGGEPLMNTEYILDTVKLFPRGWKLRIETCLNLPWENISPLVDIIDYWYIDIKDMSSDIYKKYTGADNLQVISNLYKLSSIVNYNKIQIRIPNIPKYNTPEDVKRSVDICSNFGKIEIFDYIL